MLDFTRGLRWAAVLAIFAVLLSACAPSSPLPGASGSSAARSVNIVVGSADFSESVVLGELYAQAMQAKGLRASTRLGIGNREVYLSALQDGSVSVVPEYSGNLLLHFDQNNPAETAAEIGRALPEAVGPELTTLEASAAADQDVYVVTKEFSKDKDVTSLEDLEKVSSKSVLGGPSELKKRSYGPPGLKGIYGASFAKFRGYDSTPARVKALNSGKLQVATFFTTEAAIADNDYVQLSDPEQMILPQNIVPLVRNDVAENQEAVAAIEGVQRALTTKDLTKLNSQVDGKQQSPTDAAAAWLKEKGLV